MKRIDTRAGGTVEEVTSWSYDNATHGVGEVVSVQQANSGDKKPGGPSLKLLNVVFRGVTHRCALSGCILVALSAILCVKHSDSGMRIFKTKGFSKWAADEGLTDAALRTAVEEMAAGLIDAELGGEVCKKRVGIEGRGKSGGVRTLVAFREGDKTFFMHGFAKNAQANIKANELAALKLLAKKLLGYSAAELEKALKGKALVEVRIAAI